MKTGILALIFLMAAGVLGIMGLMGSASSSATSPVTVGIDFNTGDNTATTVGAITTCREVASGGSYTLDVYVQNIPGPASSGMIGGQFTLNSVSGNTLTARSVTGGFIDTNPSLSASGATIDSGASTALPNSTGSDTPVSSNDNAIGGNGATGDGWWVRMTYTAPAVGSATTVTLSLSAVTLDDPIANEITATVVKSATLIIAPDGTTNCAAPTLATLTETKVCVPSGDPGQFNLQIDGATAGTGANAACGGTTGAVVVNTGGHTVGETAVAGTSLANYSTAFSANCAGGAITLTAGQNAVCTITNTRLATLTVNKVCLPVTDTGHFNLQIDGGSAGTGANAACGGTTGAVVVSVGGHSVGETAGTGTSLANYAAAVIGGDCAVGGAITLAAGQNAVCTITNTRLATLTVNKVCLPVTDTGKFQLVITPGPTSADKACGGSTGAVQLSPGAYTVSETAGTGTSLANYAAAAIGGDCAVGGAITLAAGQNAVCTITNTRNSATFTVNKVFSDGNPDSVTVSLTCGAGASNSPQPASSDSPAVFTVTGIPADGTSCTAFEGTAPSDYTESDNCSAGVPLAANGSASCTITNTLNSATFTVNKVFSDGNPASVTVSLTCGAGASNSPQPASSDSPAVFIVTGIPADGTSCTAFEGTAPSGYTESDNCSAGVPLAANGSASCTITNTLNSATFTVNKVFSDGNPASVTVSLTCGAGASNSPQPASSESLAVFTVTGIPADGTSCTAFEGTAPGGYTESDNCSAGVPLAANGSASCTITNTLQPPDVTVAKATSTATVSAGGTGQFKITTSNLGPGTATSLTMSDTLPAGLFWSIDAANTDAVSNADCSIGGLVLTCAYGSQASGFTSFVTVQATTSTANCGTVTNADAHVSADDEDPTKTSNNDVTAAFNVLCATGRHDVGVKKDGFKVDHEAHPGQKRDVHIKIKNFGTVTETQVGYRIMATCASVGGCHGTMSLTAACTGTVGPLKKGKEVDVHGCRATPSLSSHSGESWKLTLIVIHCGVDGGPPCTTNDGGVDANPSNNLAVRTMKIHK